MRENVLCLAAQLRLPLCNPIDCSPPGSSVQGDSPGKNTGVGCHALLQGIFPTQGSNPGLLYCRWILFFFLQVDSLPSEPPGNPKNTGVGSLFLLQCIFSTQESNWDLLHCRRILSAELPRKPIEKFKLTWALWVSDGMLRGHTELSNTYFKT